MKKNIGVIILAAGWGRRIGKSKALLRLDDKSYLEFIIDKFCSFGLPRSIVAVVNTEVEKYIIQNQISVKYQLNKNPDKGMSSSIKLGLDKLSGKKYYLIYPVDHPNVSITTITKLFESLNNRKEYYQPQYKGRNGHPIIIHNSIISEIYDKLDSPLNLLLKNYLRQIIQVNDKEILRNINYPKDIIRKTKKEN